MKKTIPIIVLIIASLCIFVVISGFNRAAFMQEITEAGMTLRADSTNISNIETKLYELAYSSPYKAEQVGIWAEAVLPRKFETFATEGQKLTPELAKKLKGWPIKNTIEIDLSSSSTNPEMIAELGALPSLQWIDLSNTQITSDTLVSLLTNAPTLRKLQINKTDQITWNDSLVDQLLSHPKLRFVEIEESAMTTELWTRLQTELLKQE